MEELFILLMHDFTKCFNTEPEKQRIRQFVITKYFLMQLSFLLQSVTLILYLVSSSQKSLYRRGLPFLNPLHLFLFENKITWWFHWWNLFIAGKLPVSLFKCILKKLPWKNACGINTITSCCHFFVKSTLQCTDINWQKSLVNPWFHHRSAPKKRAEQFPTAAAS